MLNNLRAAIADKTSPAFQTDWLEMDMNNLRLSPGRRDSEAADTGIAKIGKGSNFRNVMMLEESAAGGGHSQLHNIALELRMNEKMQWKETESSRQHQSSIRDEHRVVVKQGSSRWIDRMPIGRHHFDASIVLPVSPAPLLSRNVSQEQRSLCERKYLAARGSERLPFQSSSE